LTNVPGSSEIFREGFVTYSNEAKTRLLNVPAELIRQHGAVSAEVAAAMAEGALAAAEADFALAVTGIAGPDGGSPEKPVGTVFIALAVRKEATQVSQEFFPTDRETFKQIVSQKALDMLRLEIFPVVTIEETDVLLHSEIR
jgi:nicotinamide-nucleotide amidase